MKRTMQQHERGEVRKNCPYQRAGENVRDQTGLACKLRQHDIEPKEHEPKQSPSQHPAGSTNGFGALRAEWPGRMSGAGALIHCSPALRDVAEDVLASCPPRPADKPAMWHWPSVQHQS